MFDDVKNLTFSVDECYKYVNISNIYYVEEMVLSFTVYFMNVH